MRQLENYQSRCILSAMGTISSRGFILSQLSDGALHAIHESDLRSAKRMVAVGWLATGLSPKGKTRYRLTDGILTEIEAIGERFARIVDNAGAISGMSGERFISEYGSREYGSAHHWQMFPKIYERIVEEQDSGWWLLNHFADAHEPRDLDQQRLINLGLAVVHEFCGKPYISATGAVLAMRMEALVEAGKTVAARKRNAVAARESTLASKAENPRPPERQSIWFDLVPKEIAKQQVNWDKAFAALRMKALGFTLAQIADRFGVSKVTVQNRIEQARRASRRGSAPPVEIYLNDKASVRSLMGKMDGIQFTFTHEQNPPPGPLPSSNTRQ